MVRNKALQGMLDLYSLCPTNSLNASWTRTTALSADHFTDKKTGQLH